jgi:hypothetical protein
MDPARTTVLNRPRESGGRDHLRRKPEPGERRPVDGRASGLRWPHPASFLGPAQPLSPGCRASATNPRPGRHQRRDRARRNRRRPQPVRRRPALQAFAGSAPVTRALGKSRTVTRRRTKNNRLAAIGYCWAFTAAARPSPAREHYLRRRGGGDGHPAALRHCSTGCSANSTTAYAPARSTTQPRPSPTPRTASPTLRQLPLDRLATSEVSRSRGHLGSSRFHDGGRSCA